MAVVLQPVSGASLPLPLRGGTRQDAASPSRGKENKWGSMARNVRRNEEATKRTMKPRLHSALLAFTLAAGQSLAAAAPSAASPEASSARLAPSSLNLKPSTKKPLAPSPFRGYPEAYVLHNARVHAVVVPSLFRLVFLAPSADAPNLLRLDSALADTGALPPDPATAPGFFNIGGDWVWPVAQSNWPAFSPNASDWPPPPALADGPSTVEAWVDGDGTQHVNLIREYPPPVSATLERTFILSSDASHLECEQVLYPSVFDEEENDLPLALWHISQVTNPDKIHFVVPTPDFTPAVMAGTLVPGSFVVDSEWQGTFFGGTPLGRPATYTPPPSSEVKLFLPTSSLSARTPNGFFTVTIEETTPDFHAELYSNTGLGYAELETVTPDSSSVPHVSTLANTLVYCVFPPAGAPHPAQ